MNNQMAMLGWGQPSKFPNQMNPQESPLIPGVQVDPMAVPPVNPVPSLNFAKPSFMQGMAGYTDAAGIKTNGWGGMALGAAQGAFNGYLGMRQLDLAKDQLSENKRQFEMNWGAQRNLTNSRLEDRQKQRLANRPGGYESVEAYMAKNGVK